MAPITGKKYYPDELNAAGHSKSILQYRDEEVVYVMIAGKHLCGPSRAWRDLADKLKICFGWNDLSGNAVRNKYTRACDLTKGTRIRQRRGGARVARRLPPRQDGHCHDRGRRPI